MSEDEDRYTHINVRIPFTLLKLLNDLCKIEVKDKTFKIHDRADIAREALSKGVRLMLIEKLFLDKVMKIDAKKTAKMVYTHLEETAKKTEQVAVNDERGVPVQKER